MTLVAWLLAASPAIGQEIVYPQKDGTIADGYAGPFDGVPDEWDWWFDQSGYEGSILLSTDPPQFSRENRLVWEYNLSGVTTAPPVSATLTFTIRGGPIDPWPDAEVHVYSYPADLVESPYDYSAEPAVFQGSATVASRQPPTVYTLDVSDVVNAALAGNQMVAFRFQIDPNTPNGNDQAVIEALDDDPATKPYLVIDEGSPGQVPGDINGDGLLDMADVDAMVAVLMGTPLHPDDVARADMDNSGTADGDDLQPFVDALTG